MKHDIYIFGSATRGEVFENSDLDVLVIPEDIKQQDYPDSWSVYSRRTIQSYYFAGRLFAWHLHLEAVCVFKANTVSYLDSLGKPNPYEKSQEDVADLKYLLVESISELRENTRNKIFELGIVYTALRDIAMAASWKLTGKPIFSRMAPFMLSVDFPFTRETYEKLMKCRYSSTRGLSIDFDLEVLSREVLAARIDEWIETLNRKV